MCFSALGVLLFALGVLGLAAWWVGVGVTAYGACYLFVHEVYIHHRLPVRVPPPRLPRVVARCRTAVHHLSSAEPYGMLLPCAGESRAPRSARDPLDRGLTADARPPYGADASRRRRSTGEDALGAVAVVALHGDERRVDDHAVDDHQRQRRAGGSRAVAAGTGDQGRQCPPRRGGSR